jgi:glycosyltransferase involved in cell wall biosynthesis
MHKMKLLIITQKIDSNDDVLGFFHAWIAEFAKHCEQVTAIGLSVGAHDLPKNVRIFSLGKESGASRLKYLGNFYRLIFRERHNYDAVFVHMNPEYIILGGVLWKIMGKKIGLWYTHKQVDWRLRMAVHGVDVIFTASPESFRLPTPKLHVVGHGIDADRFEHIRRIPDGVFRILSIGRIAQAKGYGTLFRALELLKDENSFTEVHIVGAPITAADKIYATELQSTITQQGWEKKIVLVGAVPNNAIEPYLAKADLFVNMSTTGSLDKAVLEAMVAGVPVLTSNEGLRTALSGFEQTCIFKENDAKDFADHIRALMAMPEEERKKLGRKLHNRVETYHNLRNLIPRILGLY